MNRLMGVGQGGDMHDRLTLDEGEADRGGRVEYLDRWAGGLRSPYRRA